MWVRGLKQLITDITQDSYVSHPMWVRGLKHLGCIQFDGSVASHPMWVRGLKLVMVVNRRTTNAVAPYVGAWIETE